MYKALLFDIDGVLLIHKQLFIDEISKTLNDEAYTILHMFNDEEINIKCDKGECDPLVEIKPYLQKAGWKQGVEEYLEKEYSFEERGIDYSLLSMIAEINNRKMKCFIGSNQNYHRKAFLIEKMRLNEIVEESYFSCDLGSAKPETAYWENAFSRMKEKISSLMPQEVLFFDDKRENVDSASKYGFTIKHVIERSSIEEKLVEILS